MRFEIVENGAMAVEVYKTSHPKIILMDVSMPEMNGLEATKVIRELESGSGIHTPIIGVTAHALNGDMEKCMEAGMDDYLQNRSLPTSLTKRFNSGSTSNRARKSQHSAQADANPSAQADANPLAVNVRCGEGFSMQAA